MAVKIDKLTYLQIGQRDENLGRDITLDATDWVELFPDASIHILFRRPGEDTVTPVLTELTEDGMLVWHVAQFEVGMIGVGHAEIRAVNQEGLRRKSVVVPCSIEETITGEDGAVLYTQDEVNQTLANIGDATRAAAEAAADAAAAAGYRDEASNYADAAEVSKDAAAQSAQDAVAQVVLAAGHAGRAEIFATRAETAADMALDTHGIFWLEMDENENVWYYRVGATGLDFVIDEQEVLYAYVRD